MAGYPNTPAYLKGRIQAVLELAKAEGFVITVERRPLQPLAMGHAEYDIQVREARQLAAPKESAC